MSCSRRTKSSLISAALLVLQGCALIDKVTGEGEAKRIRRIGHSAQALVVSSWDTGWTWTTIPSSASSSR
jgi:hypothetical protein